MAKESEWETIVPAPRPATRPAPAKDAQGWETIVPAPAPVTTSAKDAQGWETIVPAKAPTQAPAQVPVAKDDTEAYPFLREVADLPLKFGSGAVTGVRMVADAFGADSDTSKNLRGVEDYIAALYSAQSKKDSQEMARIMKDAEDKGVLANLVAAGKAFSVAPADLLANALGTAAPAIAVAIGTFLTGGTPLIAGAATLGTGAVMGAGTIKGAVYDATKEVLSEKTKLSPEQIEKIAVDAQSYRGENLDQILIGSLAGAFGARTGAELVIARQLAKGIATNVAQKEAVKLATKEATEQAAKRGIVKQAAITGGTDFLGEGFQGGQEQLAKNLALQRQGFDVPTMRGVVGQGALEGLAGLGMGTISGGREAYTAKNEVALQNAAKLTSQEQEELRDRFTTSSLDTKAADRAPTKQELDSLNAATPAPPGSVIPPAPPTPLAEELKAYIEKIPEGKEEEVIKPQDTRKLIAQMKELGLPAPKADKTKGESTRVLAVQALRQYFAAGGEQLTDIPDIQGTADGTQAAQTQQTTPQGQQTTPAPDVTPPPAPTVDVTPPTPAAPVAIPMIKAVDTVYKGALAKLTANPNDKKALDTVNSLERKHNMPLTSTTPQGGVLSAKSKKVAPVIEEEVNTAYAYDPDLSPELNQQIANSIAAEQELIDQEKLTADLAETDAKEAGKINMSKEDIAAFEKIREEHNADADARNKKRVEAQKALEAATKKANAAIAAEAAYKKENKVKKNNPAWRRLTAEAEKAIAEEEAADALLKSLDAQAVPFIPDWSDLSVEDKNIYFGNIKYGDYVRPEEQPTRKTALTEKQKPPSRDVAMFEHRKAGQALVQALTNRPSKMAANEQRVIGAYNDNRTRVNKQFNTVFPKWRDLTEKAKEIFREGLTNFSGLQLDRSFGRLAEYLGREDTGKKERLDILTGVEIQDRLERVQRESDEQKKRIPAGYETEVDPLTGKTIPPRFGSNLEKSRLTVQRDNDKLRMLIGNSDLFGALEHISGMKSVSKFNRVIAKAVASMVKGMKSPPRLMLVSKLSNDDHGQYDPSFTTPNRENIGKISIRTVSPTIVLHEAIHAVTVQVINKYLDGDTSLTNAQIAGVKQLLKIMAVTRDYVDAEGVRFGDKHLEAYDNIFEFVSYALTKEDFQNDLADINLPAESRFHYANYAKGDANKGETTNISNISSQPRSAWTEFKLSVAKLITAGVKRVKEVVSKEDQKEAQERLEKEFQKQGKYVPVDREAIVEEDVLELKAVPLADMLFDAGVLDPSANQNFLMEIAAAFEDIMAPQTGAIVLDETSLSATSAPRTAQELRSGGINDDGLREAMLRQGLPEGGQKTGVFKSLFTQDGWRNMARLVQDRTYEARSYFRRQDLGGKIVRDMTKSFNNVTEHLDLSMGEMRNYLDNYLRAPFDNYKAAVSEYVKIAGKGFDEALVDLQLFGEMLHEPERRKTMFIVAKPLNTTPNLIQNGQPISAAQRRIDILGDMRTGKPGIVHKFKLTEAQRTALWAELTNLAENYGDRFGDSPRLSKAQIEAAKDREDKRIAANPNAVASTLDPALDPNNDLYNALGISSDEVKLRETQFNDNAIVSPERRAAAMKVFETMQKINKATADLNKIGNYWSTPVDNLVGMYNYQYYMPFKGKAKNSEIDHSLDPNNMGKGKDLQEIEYEATGRFSIADNPVLQVLNDAFRSARRAGVRNYTQSIKNALSADPKLNPGGTGILRGVVHKNIKFEDRGVANLQEFKGGQYIFHYNEDGSIDILKVTDPKMLQALRYSFKDSNIFLQLANNITSFIGSTHTRYNLNFAPKNFLVDALTNAWNIGGGKLGPLKSAAYIKDIAYQVSKNGLGKALEVAIYHEKGDPASQKRLADMADKDPFVQAMLEMIQFGGKTTYVENFSLKGNLEKLKKLNRNRILRTKDSIETMLDSWNGMFEFTSRTAAYMLYKESAYAKNKADPNMSDAKGPNGEMSPAERAACVEAAAETKNLANFEKSGEWAEYLGAWFMFIRPSATGAVRGIETVAPAFTAEKYAKANMPANIAADPAAAEKYMKEFKKLRTNAQLMTGTLIGMGYGLWWMSSLMAPDDEWERNSTQNDNMQQWTKYARFHIPNGVSEAMGMGKDVVFQMPWGFGLGAFMSMGAQIAGMAHGNTSLKDGIGNIVLGGLADSFLPLPVSRIPITDKPGLWLADSILPSVIRPYFEYFWNVNGIGQAINSASQRKFGDAFTGGDRIPEAWKDLTAYAYNKTGGALNISPNTAYFFANSYADGFTRLGELAYSWTDIGAGEKGFNPKTDIPLLGSFFGAKSNVDARDFTAVEDKLKNFDERIKTLKVTSPEAYAKFITNNPTAETAVGIYYAQLGSLSKVREEANKIRLMPISQKDRQELLRANIFRQNIIKRQMIETFKALGIEP